VQNGWARRDSASNTVVDLDLNAGVVASRCRMIWARNYFHIKRSIDLDLNTGDVGAGAE
jgi:hypothetical protein